MNNPYLPYEVEIVDRIQETPHVYTLRLKFCDPEQHAQYRFMPGQFNMLYLHGVGEVPISIVSDPEDDQLFDHTIRSVGRVTDAMARLQKGERLGIRGPFGRGWPVEEAKGHDLLLATGGLGCAPVLSVINYVMRRREEYGQLVIMQGVKHADDLFWRESYNHWNKLAHTQVLLAANEGGDAWPWHIGRVTELMLQAELNVSNTMAMMCGPEGMMISVIKELQKRGVPEHLQWLSMERNMQCAVGHCGHCQFGGKFICKQGPVFSYPEVKDLLGRSGF